MNKGQLQAVNLFNAQLQEASLDDADLRCADLRGANLRNAHLHGTDFTGVNLEGENLMGARLEGAKFNGAKVKGALLQKADIGGTNFKDTEMDLVDLRYANPLTDKDKLERELAEYMSKYTKDKIMNELPGSIAAFHIKGKPKWLLCDKKKTGIPECISTLDSRMSQEFLCFLFQLARNDDYIAKGLANQVDDRKEADPSLGKIGDLLKGKDIATCSEMTSASFKPQVSARAQL